MIMEFMKNIILKLSFFLIYSLVSCKQNLNDRCMNEVRTLSGSKIEFPGNYEVYPSFMEDSLWTVMRHQLKVLTYIEEPPCTECIASTLAQWKEIISEIDSELLYVFVVKTNERKEEIQNIFEGAGLFPFVIYDDDSFKDKNGLDVLSVNRTLLLDTDNNVLIVGEPFWNDNMVELYRNCVEKEKR